jgi:DNA polymerase III gamma/tau subunit
MNPVDPILYKNDFLNSINMPNPDKITDDMWSWIINIAGNNISDLVRLIKLIRDIHITFKEEITLQTVRILCSAPFYMDFIPLLNAMAKRDNILAIKSLLLIWKRGYAYEDILESFQIINNLFGNNVLKDNVLIHKFLINAWISYCKGNTSILALQNIVYKTLMET